MASLLPTTGKVQLPSQCTIKHILQDVARCVTHTFVSDGSKVSALNRQIKYWC